MIELKWTPIVTFRLADQDVVGPWLVACDVIGAATTRLKLKAKGEWTAMSGLPACGPDGLPGQAFPDDRLVVADCPVGALVGKIGGSSATLKAVAIATEAGEAKPFAIGSQTALKLPDNAIGPLYVGFNILNRPLKVKTLELEILGAS
jgi:hypothetical protein